MENVQDKTICVVGLGYVGLPLLIALSKKYKVIGFDTDDYKINLLNNNISPIADIDLNSIVIKNVKFTSNEELLTNANFYIITVPTPIKKNYDPDLKYLKLASETVGKYLQKDDIVMYESTVYPGITENFCGKKLEEISNLKLNKDFFIGYSPERINPGDKIHKFNNINKIVSASSEVVLPNIVKIYSDAVSKGRIYVASNIKTAEASKIIENTQRDINIAFMNEVSKLMHLFDVDTNEMLELASTKWNFLNFKPGLVGGHCIGVDPYYLKYQSEKMGITPPLITVAREINETMTDFIVDELLHSFASRGITDIKDKKVLIKGLSFKENIDDIRNSKSIDIINKLKGLGMKVYFEDPLIDSKLLFEEYGLKMPENIPKVDAILFTVAHDKYKSITIDEIESLCTSTKILFDIKNIFNKKEFEKKGFLVWNL